MIYWLSDVRIFFLLSLIKISIIFRDKKFSLSIRSGFFKGKSETTETFNNPPLIKKDQFFVTNFEVWTFDE